MNGRTLLDTNVVIGLLENQPTASSRFQSSVESYVGTVVLGELYYGAFRSTRRQRNLTRISAFLAEVAVITSDTETALEYGRVKSELAGAGRPIPDNDIWIAALARQHDLTLVTRDAHFDAVNALRTERW